MKLQFQFFSAAIVIASSQLSYAINPIDGVYGGLTLGASYAEETSVPFNRPAASSLSFSGTTCSLTGTNLCNKTNGNLDYDVYGNIGGQIGIRRNHWRLEAQLFGNYNTIDKVTFGNTQIKSPKTSDGLRVEGDTTLVALMFNGIYDFYSTNPDCNIAPYLGAGIGYGYIYNESRFYCNNSTIPCSTFTESSNGLVGQIIAGVGYFADQFTWFGLDYRYISADESNISNNRLAIHTVNLTISGTFYCT